MLPALQRPTGPSSRCRAPALSGAGEHPPTRLQDLTPEILKNIADCIVDASHADERNTVESLNVTPRFAAILADELQGDKVLRTIRDSRDMPGLCAAFMQIRNVCLPYRVHCLKAVWHLLPRMDHRGGLPDSWWPQLRSLLSAMRPALCPQDKGTDSREKLLLQLIDFARLNRPGLKHTRDQQIAGHIETMRTVPPAHLATYLSMAKNRWLYFSAASAAARERYQEMFQRLGPLEQVDCVQRDSAPYLPDEIAAFLLAGIGQVPATRLLEAAKRTEARRDGPISTDYLKLLRQLVTQSVDKPELVALLHGAVDYRTVRDPDTLAFIAQHAAGLPEGERLALHLHLDLAIVGTGDSPSSRDGGLERMSRRVDELLDGDPRRNAPSLETLVDADVSWLAPAQRSRLIDRVMALPPLDAARLLAVLVRRLPHVRPDSAARALVDKAITACRWLPVEHRTAPVASLLHAVDGMRPQRSGDHGSSRAICRIYRALPAGRRPLFDPAWRWLLASTQDGAPPGAARSPPAVRTA